MARPGRYRHFLEVAKEEALIACDFYNARRRARNLESFLVHMCIAWNNLLQAIFERDDVDYYYRDKRNRFVRVDGEKMSWDLARAVREHIPNAADPVRKNIEFFIGLRNKVEHRLDKKAQTALTNLVAGKCQALIRNFEALLMHEFGVEESLADELRLPLFLSSLTDDAVDAVKTIRATIPKGVVAYIDDYDAAAGDAVSGDAAYDFRVLLVRKIGAPSKSDLAVEFVNENTLTDDQRKAVVMIRDRHVGVANDGLLKPGEVVKRIQEEKFADFDMNAHTVAWRHFEVRPPAKSADKTKTKSQYCVWNRPHGDYLYTDAWVKKLIKEMGDNPVAAIAGWG